MDFYYLAHFVTKNLYKVLFKVNVIGQDNIPESGSAIICSNHKSNFDPIAAAVMTTDKRVHFMAKKELYDNKFLGWLITKLETFPVNRVGNDLKAIKTAMKILKTGDFVGIFPEGTRTEEIDLSKAKTGIIMLAIKSKVPIIPIYIDSEYKFRKPLDITVKKPIYYDKYYGKKLTNEEYQVLAEDLLKKIYGI